MRDAIAERQRGGALLIALVVVALASVLAVGLMERGQGSLARTQALIDSERSYQYARGMELLAADLLDDALTGEVEPATLAGAWTPPFDVPGGMVQGRLLDQGARFNLTALVHPDQALARAAFDQFERLLEMQGLDPVIAAELADWMETGSVPRPGSVGDSWYAGQQPPYRTGGTALAHASELRWLRSVDGAAWERLQGLVTALPDRSRRFNINTMPPELLASLFDEVSPAEARRVLADGPFGQVSALLEHPVLAGHARPGLERHLVVTSEWYLAQARVVLDGVERDYFRLMRLGGSGYDFRYFSQGTP